MKFSAEEVRNNARLLKKVYTDYDIDPEVEYGKLMQTSEEMLEAFAELLEDVNDWLRIYHPITPTEEDYACGFQDFLSRLGLRNPDGSINWSKKKAAGVE